MLDLRQQLSSSAEKRNNLLDQVRSLEQALALANARVETQENVTTQLQALLEGSNPEGIKVVR